MGYDIVLSITLYRATRPYEYVGKPLVRVPGVRVQEQPTYGGWDWNKNERIRINKLNEAQQRANGKSVRRELEF